MKQLDTIFLKDACDILGDTKSGLSGRDLIQYCKGYASVFNKKIPYASFPFDADNKRTALG